jgi:hypothetical protein
MELVAILCRHPLPSRKIDQPLDDGNCYPNQSHSRLNHWSCSATPVVMGEQGAAFVALTFG